MSDKRPLPLAALGREPRRIDDVDRTVPRASVPPRGRHAVGLARIPLRRATVTRGAVVQERSRADRRREQMPLPAGFVDRRRAA